jgi:hypothetical protein
MENTKEIVGVEVISKTIGSDVVGGIVDLTIVGAFVGGDEDSVSLLNLEGCAVGCETGIGDES